MPKQLEFRVLVTHLRSMRQAGRGKHEMPVNLSGEDLRCALQTDLCFTQLSFISIVFASALCIIVLIIAVLLWFLLVFGL